MSPKTRSLDKRITVARRIAAEDLSRGDYVTLLYHVVEMPTFFWDCNVDNRSPEELIRTRYLPDEPGVPFRVVDVCLPFIYTRRPGGTQFTFDTRRHELVRLDAKCGLRVWKRQRPATSKKKKRKKNRK